MVAAGARNPLWRWLLVLAGALLLLAVGISIGRALDDGPAPGGSRTIVRTLEPRPLAPAATTVTVTVDKRLNSLRVLGRCKFGKFQSGWGSGTRIAPVAAGRRLSG